jgi:hypothetical protein
LHSNAFRSEGERKKKKKDLNILKGPPIEKLDLLLNDRHCYSSGKRRRFRRREARERKLKCGA